jgi:hypothetical protein
VCSWFAYNTGRESRVTEQDLTVRYHSILLSTLFCSNLSTHTVQLYHPSPTDAVSPAESFQHRVGELGRLAAYITLDPEIATKPRVEQARLRLESLNEWHRTLPPTMQLRWLNHATSVPWYTKRSLLQLHMLFLGLFNEPYRSCLADVGRSRLSETTSELETLDSMKVVEKECVIAARQCARVVSLLQTDNLIRSHCWVSMYVHHPHLPSLPRQTKTNIQLITHCLGTRASPAAPSSSSAPHRNFSCSTPQR